MRIDKDTSFADNGVIVTIHDSNEKEKEYQLTIRVKNEENISFYMTAERYYTLKAVMKEADIYFSDIS